MWPGNKRLVYETSDEPFCARSEKQRRRCLNKYPIPPLQVSVNVIEFLVLVSPFASTVIVFSNFFNWKFIVTLIVCVIYYTCTCTIFLLRLFCTKTRKDKTEKLKACILLLSLLSIVYRVYMLLRGDGTIKSIFTRMGVANCHVQSS